MHNMWMCLITSGPIVAANVSGSVIFSEDIILVPNTKNFYGTNY